MDYGLSDSEFVTKVINSLPDSYEPIIGAMSTVADQLGTELKPESVSKSIITEFRRRKTKKRVAEDAAALAVRMEDATSGSRKEITCFHCGKVGHMKRECRKLKSEQKANAIPSYIVFDSGASVHMTPNRDSFITFREMIPPKRVRGADQNVFLATGIGYSMTFGIVPA